MKKCLFLTMAICLFCTIAVVVACSNDEYDFIEESSQQTVNSESESFVKYIETKKQLNFKRQFNLEDENVKTRKTVINRDNRNANIYVIPVSKDGLEGNLFVFQKKDSKISEALFEDRSNFSLENGGETKIYGMNKKYIATLEYKKVDANLFTIKIVDVSYTEKPQIKAGTEWPSEDEGYITCVAKCLKIAQDACNADPECNLMCTVGDFFLESCTAAIVSACAIHCI